MAEPEDISIVMAVYNHEATVAEALESALMQEMPYRSVIYCLNDASTDKSGEILAEYAEKYPERIKVYTSSKNLGSGKKSFLFHKPPAEGRYWCLLAGDDYWTTKDKLAKQIGFLDANPEYVGCSCDTVMINEATGTKTIIRPDRNSWNLLDLLLLRRRYAFYVHTTSIIWRNIFIDKGSFLPPAFARPYAFGDVILGHMMLAKGGLMRNLPEIMSCYRVTGKGVWTSRSKEEQEKINRKLKLNIIRSIPMKYLLLIALQSLRLHSVSLKKLILGPINE